MNLNTSYDRAQISLQRQLDEPLVRHSSCSTVSEPGPERCPTCPHFLPTPTSVVSSVGERTNLSCGVRNLGNSMVSWIRRSDLHVLTTGDAEYTSDSRFHMKHVEGSPYWILVIHKPTTRDSGIYECQVSTQPKMFRRFTLSIIEPRAEISGTSELFMRAGSDINVTCVVVGAPRGTPIQWYHTLPQPPGTVGENIQLVSEGNRGGVQLVTNKHKGTSWLLVTSATWRDAGTYSCAPKNAHPASITVHVLDEDAPAAMQSDSKSSKASSLLSSIFAVAIATSISSYVICRGSSHIATATSAVLALVSSKARVVVATVRQSWKRSNWTGRLGLISEGLGATSEVWRSHDASSRTSMSPEAASFSVLRSLESGPRNP
ncbi:uncharacterized protein LOC143026004 [Oratosquilla oratoria]|uniref:uncharacterized protein LOC143026004 n=1 Tax=Oratosquilla oratoria TaxID=337810 RepID=UPI003F76AF4D